MKIILNVTTIVLCHEIQMKIMYIFALVRALYGHGLPSASAIYGVLPLLKKSTGNPYLKIDDFSKLLVVDTSMIFFLSIKIINI